MYDDFLNVIIRVDIISDIQQVHKSFDCMENTWHPAHSEDSRFVLGELRLNHVSTARLIYSDSWSKLPRTLIWCLVIVIEFSFEPFAIQGTNTWGHSLEPPFFLPRSEVGLLTPTFSMKKMAAWHVHTHVRFDEICWVCSIWKSKAAEAAHLLFAK